MKTAPILLLLSLFAVGCASNGHRQPAQYNPYAAAQTMQQAAKLFGQGNAHHYSPAAPMRPVIIQQQQNHCDLRCQNARQQMLQKMYFGN